jgi:hypothetical protein
VSPHAHARERALSDGGGRDDTGVTLRARRRRVL